MQPINPPYLSLISRDERRDCMQFGLVLKQAEDGRQPGLRLQELDLDGFEKQAQIVDSLNSLIDTGASGVALASLILGLPLGVTAHMISRGSNMSDAREASLRRQAQAYQKATDNLAIASGDLTRGQKISDRGVL